MLDEFREYEEYTCNLDDENAVVRFEPKVFAHQDLMKGLRRALTIIARKELDERGFFSGDGEIRTDIVAEVEQVLKNWTGFTDDVQDSWLERYYNKAMKDSKKSWADVCDKKKKQFGKKIFSDSKSGKNDLLEITYDRIIADAIYFGPLNRYYLVCKADSDSQLKNNVKRMDPGKPKNAEQIDNVFKVICAYLIQQKNTGCLENYVNNAEIAHWAQNNEINKGTYFKSQSKNIHYEGSDIFIKRTVSKNVSKLIVCPEYMEKYDFYIVNEKDFNGVPEGYTFYSDAGAGKMLAKEIFYKPLDK